MEVATVRTFLFLGMLFYAVRGCSQTANTPHFLSFPFDDPTIKLQQGWVYEDGPKHAPFGAFDYIKGDLDRRRASPFWSSFQVVAAADGVATWEDDKGFPCRNEPKLTCYHGYGNVVLIRHAETAPDGLPYFTLYAHLADGSIPTCAPSTPPGDFCIPKLGRHNMAYSQWKSVKRGDLLGMSGATGDLCDGRNVTDCIHLHFEVFKGRYSDKIITVQDPYDISTPGRPASAGFRRDRYPAGANFAGCGSSFLWIGRSDKQTINGNDVSHPDGSLLKAPNDPTVYLIGGGQKRPVSSVAVLNNLYILQGGFDIKDVIIASNGELQQYVTGQPIASSLDGNGQTEPDGRIVRAKDGARKGEIAVVSRGQIRPIVSMEIFHKLGYLLCNVKDLVAADYARFIRGSDLTGRQEHSANQTPVAAFVMESQGKRAFQGEILNLAVLPESSATVSFNGSYPTYSKDDGTISRWVWRIGSAIIGMTPTFTADFPVGSHDVSLVVTDNLGLSSSPATARIVVTADSTLRTGNAVTDFSLSSNPNGPWSYGYSDTLAGAFTLHTTAQTDFVLGVDRWATPSYDPFLQIARNKTGAAILGSPSTFTYPPDMLHMHPSPPARYDVVRWNAPSNGTYTVQGKFAGLDMVTNVADTDVHVRVNATSVFTAVLRGTGTEAPFTISRTLNVGDRVDFAVGVGPSGVHSNDSTGLAVTITPASSPSGLMNTPRHSHTATLLNNGLVLVTGGIEALTFSGSQTAEIYNPQTGTWRYTRNPLGQQTNMIQRRASHSATLLPNGKVLLAGGGLSGAPQGAEIFDPDTETFSATASMQIGRNGHAAVALTNGNVLVAGGHGDTNGTAELYNWQQQTWTILSLNSGGLRHNPAGARLQDGRVLITGGGFVTSRRVDLYDPTSNTWMRLPDMRTPRLTHTATALTGNKVLLVGGENIQTAPAGSETYEALVGPSGQSTDAGQVQIGQWLGTATLLPNGNVVISGGHTYGPNPGCPSLGLPNVQLFSSSKGVWTPLSPMTKPRTAHTATLLPTGRILIAGGFEQDGLACGGQQPFVPQSELLTPP